MTAPATGIAADERIYSRIENPEAGNPLLLINGIGASGHLFGPFQEHLGYRTMVTFDAPGVGESPTPFFTPSLRRIASWVIDMLDSYGLEKVDVLGVSWGGLLSQEIARRYPDRVRRLVLMATSTGWTSQPGEFGALGHLMSPMRYFSDKALRSAATTLYGDEISNQPELLDRQIETRLSRPPTWLGYTHQLRALIGWTSLPWLRYLEQPTLVVSGEDDTVVPTFNGRLLASQIPNASLYVAEGGGHLVHLTRPAEIAKVVSDFLE